MSYLQYFGFDSEPFGHAPSSRFYYASHEHTQALRRLLHCVQSMQGLAVLVGDMGRGKTTLARRLLEALPEAEYAAALVVIVHKQVAPLWLVRHIAAQLGVQSPGDNAPEVLSQLYTQLLALHQAGRRAVVLIDEAQMLETRALMEEFRGLLNLEVPGHKLISFVFFGLPSIEETLRLDPPLAQRVAMRYALQPLHAAACTAYITHRLTVVGARWPLFTDGALAAIHAYSGGVPRVINTLCDNLLLEMFLAGAQTAEREHAEAVAQNLNLVVDHLSAEPSVQAQAFMQAPQTDPAPAAPDPAFGAESTAASGALSDGAADVFALQVNAAPAAPDHAAAASQAQMPPPTPDGPPEAALFNPFAEAAAAAAAATMPASMLQTAHDDSHEAPLSFAPEPSYAPSATPAQSDAARPAPISVEAYLPADAPAWSMPAEAQQGAADPAFAAPVPELYAPAPVAPPVSEPPVAEAADPQAEDWSGLMAVGNLLTNSGETEGTGAADAPHKAPQDMAGPSVKGVEAAAIGRAAPDDVGPADYAVQQSLASTAYGTLDLDEVTALLAQIRRN